jgi:hypothetical protein
VHGFSCHLFEQGQDSCHDLRLTECRLAKAGKLLAVLAVLCMPCKELAQAAEANATLTATTLSVRGTLTITITAPLAITFSPSNPTVACQAPPGTVVATLVPTGGDNTTITWALAGDTTDFAISGVNLVVGPNGIAASTCPVAPATTNTVNETVTATQS